MATDLGRAEVCVFIHHKLMPTNPVSEKNRLMKNGMSMLGEKRKEQVWLIIAGILKMGLHVSLLPIHIFPKNGISLG